MKLNINSISKIVGVDKAQIKRRSTTGLKYRASGYLIDKGNYSIRVGSTKYHYTGNKDYYLVTKRKTNVKQNTPKFQKLLSRFGSLELSNERTAMVPMFEKGGYKQEINVLNDLKKISKKI